MFFLFHRYFPETLQFAFDNILLFIDFLITPFKAIIPSFSQRHLLFIQLGWLTKDFANAPQTLVFLWSGLQREIRELEMYNFILKLTEVIDKNNWLVIKSLRFSFEV